jgi:hypothetical protein
MVLRVLRLLLPAAILATASLATTAGSATAYGTQTIAQLELSVNCDNPTPLVCSEFGGTGGFWIWTAINSPGTEADFAGAGCGHTVGGGGGAGAGGAQGDAFWAPDTTQRGFFTDPKGNYYDVLYPVGPGFAFQYPATQGTYSAHPAPGVAIQLTVAP